MKAKNFTIMMLLLIVTLLVLVLLTGDRDKEVSAGTVDSNATIAQPGTKPYGLTYGEWSAKWWQWVLSIPLNSNPMSDETGVNCGLKQEGSVWFLAGTSGGQAERSCTIPSSKSVFFPVL